MSVTVENILHLPSMYGAKVVAGHGGLNNPVEAVSVLEYGRRSPLLDQFFNSLDFQGNELIITSFVNILDDVEAQCVNVRYHHSVGSSGMILFYVGIILPEIDQRLIDCCNENDFVLICMPGSINHKYADVIGDILFAVYRDQQTTSSFVSPLISRFSRLPPAQRNVSSLLRMLSMHLQATVIMTNAQDTIDHIVCWPQGMAPILESELPGHIPQTKDGAPVKLHVAGNSGYLHMCPALMEDAQDLRLYLFKFGDQINRNLLWQASELIQLYGHIWDEHLGKLVTSELIRAIIENEPMKMRHLAEVFRIQVENLNQMWILAPNDRQRMPDMALVAACRDYLSSISQPVVVGYYRQYLVAYTGTTHGVHERLEAPENMIEELGNLCGGYTLLYFDKLSSTADVRDAYALVEANLDRAKVIYPDKKLMLSSQLEFSAMCGRIMQVREAYHPFEIIADQLKDGPDLMQTLCAYLLDCSGNMQKTACRMCCHINTIKYRLRLVRELTGLSAAEMPDSYRLYLTAAVYRLQKQS